MIDVAPSPTGASVDARAQPRRCLVRREPLPREKLVRFVLDPTGNIVPDVDARLPGRGLWLSADRDVVNKAVAGRVFARAARCAVRVDTGLADQVTSLLAARCLDLFSLARRAGQVVAGFDLVRAALRRGDLAVLIVASDGGSDGTRRLRSLGRDVLLITAFDRFQLGAALGRDELVYAGVAPGGLARRLVEQSGRLAGFRVGVFDGAQPAPAGCEQEDRVHR